jgi:ADP-ribosylglycohydrolase
MAPPAGDFLPPDYEKRVYAGWLGKCIGVRLGAPLEGWTYEEIRNNLGEVEAYLPLPPGTLFKPDDDTALPMILIRALAEHGPDLTAGHLGQTWLNYLGDQRGTLWWGGYGVSTEHTAYLNLAGGIPAPLSGSITLNGAALAEQIGGQIFSDIWGLVAPNDPKRAADYAALAASVSHDGDGIQGGRFIAALVSQAFSEADPRRLVEGGLVVIPAGSEYARVVRAVLAFYDAAPGDWHAAYRFIAQNFGYDRYPGTVHIIPNAAIVVMALLYGAGDFSRTVQIATMAGWDTDCNAGNVGTISGVAAGLTGISWGWREPMNDILVTASVVGAGNLLDIPGCAALFCNLGRQIAGVAASPPRARYHFDYPGATHGFTPQPGGRILSLRQVATEQGGVLQATIGKLKKKEEARLYVRTYLRPHELSANYYGASFSPTIYPGQRLSARLYLPPGAPEQLTATLYVWDDNRGETHQATGLSLTPGEWHTLTYDIPELRGACLSQAGVALRNLGEPYSGSVWLDDLDWEGRPNYSYDFAQERAEYGGVSQWTILRGYWRLQDRAYHGSGHGINESYSGDILWRDYRLTVGLVPLLGENHNVNVRVQGSLRSYALGLANHGRLVLYKNAAGYRPLVEAPLAWQHGQRYELYLAAEGSRLLAGVSGGPQLEWEDKDETYLYGQIGVSNFSGCHTRYEEIRVH